MDSGTGRSSEKWNPRSDPDWQSDEEVAFHEAGHAVVAYALGGRILSMTIEEIEYPEGMERGLTRHHITGLDREIQCRLAGGKATLIRFGNRHGATHDLKACLYSLREAGHGDWSHEDLSSYLERMDRAAGDILLERWSAVGALATATLDKRTLEGLEVIAIIKTATAPAGGQMG
jgi:hypothetical protein